VPPQGDCTGGITFVTESAGRIWADLARRYGPSLVLLEHHPAPESGEGMETLDLVRIRWCGGPGDPERGLGHVRAGDSRADCVLSVSY
jgi:hypothetical protein